MKNKFDTFTIRSNTAKRVRELWVRDDRKTMKLKTKMKNNEIEVTMKEKFPWSSSETVEVSRKIRDIAQLNGCEVALTGGVLFGNGLTECNILIYRHPVNAAMDLESLRRSLETRGFQFAPDSKECWYAKSDYKGKPVDFFFPQKTITGVVAVASLRGMPR